MAPPLPFMATLLSKLFIATDSSNGVRSFGAVKCLFLSENLDDIP